MTSKTADQRIRDEYLKRAAYEQDAAAQAITRMMKFLELADVETGYDDTLQHCMEAVGVIIERERFTTTPTYVCSECGATSHHRFTCIHTQRGS